MLTFLARPRNRDGTMGYRYYFNQTLNGERKRIPLPTARTKTQAEEAAIKIAAEIHNGTYGSLSNQTFNEFVERVFWHWALDNYRDPMGITPKRLKPSSASTGSSR